MAANRAEQAAMAAQFVTPVRARHPYPIANSVSTPAAQAQWEAPPHRHSLSRLLVDQAAWAEEAARYGPDAQSG